MKWALNIPLLDNQIYAQIRKKLIDAWADDSRKSLLAVQP